MVHYPAGSSQQKMAHCGHKGKDKVSYNTEVNCGASQSMCCPKVRKKYPTNRAVDTRQDGPSKSLTM